MYRQPKKITGKNVLDVVIYFFSQLFSSVVGRESYCSWVIDAINESVH